MKAGAAVMAKIGEVMKIGGGKSEPALHRRKNRTKTLAVTAGITDAHHAGCLLDCQSSVYGFVRRHGVHAVVPAARAALLPAIRPKTVPIVMPTPAT